MSQIAFVNGTVRTGDAARPSAQAVLVSGGRIAVVGTERSVRDAADPAAEVVDLDGGALLPGMQDAHAHPLQAGIQMLQCDLTAVSEDRASYLEAVAAHASTDPGERWILGGGWSMDAFPSGIADRAGLDAVVPDRPVFLWNRDHHGAWVNGEALRRAGVTRHTPDPVDGRIERDAAGDPIGTLQEGATALIAGLVPAPTAAERLAGLERAQRHLFSIGVTAWQDAAVREDDHATYLDAAASGRLRARVVGCSWWERDEGREQIELIVARRAETPAGTYRAGSVKIMQDGVCENRTAAMLAPYLDASGIPTDDLGLSFVDPHDLRDHVAALDRLGFQVHFHALGDRAVKECLDAVAHARAQNGPSENRHHLAHLQVVDPADRARFATLDAGATVQPLWAQHDGYQDDLTIPFLGPERSALQYPFRSLLDAGAVLALGSDWPVTTAVPWEIMHVAVNRHHPDGRDALFYPEERITAEEALRGYTMGSAWVGHMDDVTGSITPGKLADLVAVDRDSLRDGFLGTEVEMTLVGGEVVYER